MEKSHKDILIRLRKNIIDDLDVDNDIIQPLRNEYILREEDIRYIYTGSTKEERASLLLDILPRCGPSTFDVFHQSLKHHYEWLSDEIDKLLGNYEIETNGEIDYYSGPSNIPPLSPMTVTREEKLKDALQQLIPAEYIALHAMKGFGKSCLVASTLKNIKLVKELFSNQVYWLKFTSDHSIDEEILIQLNTLYYNVRNLEIQPELFTPSQKDSLIQNLKCYFNKRDNCNALLILDDVYDKKIIETFDFKCKTLVLTADIAVLRRKNPKIIEMNDGFTEAETLGLFAKVLEMDVNELPVEAKRIHEECKGMPLLIAMFAAQFEEFKCDMKIRTNRWKYYLECLRKKDTTNRVMREFLEKQKTIFDICIQQLRPDLRTRYESLAIFCEDVNITPKTLEIFWEEDIYQVEELMLELCHKSLATRKWNNDLKTYIYGVHDLLLCHLRKKRTEKELIELHKSIIEKYRKYCDNDFSKLPDDNYIYQYIGYHLHEAQLHKEFTSVYLNLDFIQAKLMHVGLNDLLLDLRKYKNIKQTELFFDLERFLQEHASVIIEHRRKKCLDIVQIAMEHPYNGYISHVAHDLATKRSKHLYLSHTKNLRYANMPVTEEISMGICTVSFTDNPKLFLTGSTSGKIILWNSETKQQKIYNGHREGYFIKKIIVSVIGDCFLSLSNDGIIKLFPLFNENGEIFDMHYMHTESPRQKQSSWSGLFGNSNSQDDSLTEFCVENEVILDMAFGHDDRYIAACTDKATIQIWNQHGKVVFTLKDSKYQCIPKIAFTAQASLLHIMDESKSAIVLYTNHRNDYTTYQYLTCYNLQLQSTAKDVIFFHQIPKRDNSLMVVTKKEAIYVKWWWTEDCVHSFSKKTKGFVDNDSVIYVCATITYDGQYIILADSAGFINVWNTYSGYQPIATYKNRVVSLDSYWLKDEGYHIICGSGNSVLYTWNFPIQETDELPRKCLFDAIVKSDDNMDIVVKESPSNKIIVLQGNNLKQESEFIKGKISSLQLSDDGTEAVYVTDNQIRLLNINTGTTELVFAIDKPIQFVKLINLRNCNVVLCRWEENNLKVWQRSRPIFDLNTKAEPIYNVHIINDNYVVTVSNNNIMIWFIDVPWQYKNQISPPYSSPSISFSCLSYNQNYLAILNGSYLTLFRIICEYELYSEIELQLYFKYTFTQKVTCCNISKDERYVAVGFESGRISIIDIQKPTDIYCYLSFHTSPIKQLDWCSAAINVPLLLSLTSDEFAWWNVALAKNNIKANQKTARRSRMGISHSTSTPSFSTSSISNSFTNLQISNSRSVDTGVTNLQGDKTSTTDYDSQYWKNKVGKDPQVPELLQIVELPPSRDPKVCISSNFSKYVMIDIYGSVNTFKLFNYDNDQSEII
ncbi:hypothetical protein PUN28_008418 [Cardiocondyla obscurior]|uniref:CARD domain-containing protein n=1 Tax=Cardiocondyla obscurior TaxID=286306 RepID=A0AAW2G2W1_9HYME